MSNLVKQMIHEAQQILKNSYSPYSNYAVASCVCAEDDTLYAGVNVENSAYGLAVCAETNAICQMVAAGRKKIKKIIIMAGDKQLCPPCGACRQRIHEFSISNTLIYLCNHHSVLKEFHTDELLPHAFDLNNAEDN